MTLDPLSSKRAVRPSTLGTTDGAAPAKTNAEKQTVKVAADAVDCSKAADTRGSAAVLIGGAEAPAPANAPIHAEIDGRSYVVLGRAGQAFLDLLQPQTQGFGFDPWSDPKPMDKHKDAAARRFEGPTAVDGAKPTDLQQGKIGDCYACAASDAVSNAIPGYLEGAVIREAKGVNPATGKEERYWNVYFTDSKEPVPVDGDLYVDPSGKPLYGRSAPNASGQYEMWWPMLEKAIAKRNRNGYEGIGNGGSSTAILSLLLFQKTAGGARAAGTFSEYTDAGADRTWRLVKSAIDQSLPITASTHGEDQKALYEGTNIYPWHAYTVLGYAEEKGERYVVLRNPWGRSEPVGNGADDGIFQLKLKDFVKYYARVAGPNGPVMGTAEVQRLRFGA